MGLAGVLAAGAVVGIASGPDPSRPTLLWLPSGLALAGLLLGGRSAWPGVLAGIGIAAFLLAPSPLAAAIAAIGWVAEAAIGRALLSRLSFSPSLAHSRDLAWLAAVGAATATVGAASGTLAVSLGGAPVDQASWMDQWLGHAGGVVLVTPLALLAVHGTPQWGTLARKSESWVVLLVMFALGFVVFGGVITALPPRVVAVFLPFFLLVFAGLRVGPRGAVAAAALAIAGRLHGSGPLGGQTNLLPLFAYVLTLSVTASVLASTITQRDAADRARRAADLELAELADQVRYAQRLEGIALLAGGIAHDFNNLLLVIRANASLIEPVGAQREYVSEIEAASRQAADLCLQLLTYAGRGSPTPEPVDLEALASEMSTLLRARVPAAIRLVVESTPAPPARADRTPARQAVMNLLLNASEAIGARGGTIWLRTGAADVDARTMRQTFLHSDAEPGRYVFVEVEDDGCGMDPDTLRRVFDPFFTTKPNGRGLGLMTVAGVARGQGGAIKVTSEVGRGTRLRLLLPAWDGPLGAPAAGVPADAERAQGGTVLIVDDEPAVLRATTRILERSGYAVLAAHRGDEGVQVFRANADRVDAVLLDVTMPGLTGPEALEQMRQAAGREVAAVLMSGNLPDGTLPEVVGHPVLAKPFGAEVLLETLRRVIRARRPG